MELPFIKKYQPIKLKDFEIDEEFYNVINIFISINNLNILFIGDSGTGKTSIISAIVNEYYGDKYDSSNVLYINSLKEQGISFYRSDVKTFCQTSCSVQEKKKIVILDDLDIINEQSQQVFRNCIDKYSNNVHFIASCSNTQKVIDSLQSRLNIIKFKSIKQENLRKIMEKIIISENIIIEDDAKEFILLSSNNSIRVMINYLEKLKLIPCVINKQLVNQICTNISYNDFELYTNYCIMNKLNNAIKVVYNIYNQGYSVIDILDNYFQYIKITDIIEEEYKYNIIKLLCKYITIFHIIHEDEIELALFTNNLISIISIQK